MTEIDPIEVVKHGMLYRAGTWVRVHDGSPYRAVFVHGEARCVTWGFSADSAARRCASKARRISENDERIWQDKQGRTSRYDADGGGLS